MEALEDPPDNADEPPALQAALLQQQKDTLSRDTLSKDTLSPRSASKTTLGLPKQAARLAMAKEQRKPMYPGARKNLSLVQEAEDSEDSPPQSSQSSKSRRSRQNSTASA